MGDRRRSDTPRWEAPALIAVACVGVTLRFVRLDLGWFGVDQARDVATALDIVGGEAWPLIGPTMRRVTRLGALYHYFWALPYLLWHDPIAGYYFAASLSTAALALTWLVARRAWGATAGLVAAALAAVHPVWVIDGRIYWAPAALPFVAALLTLIALERPGRGRMLLLGAVLGLAVQLHLSMVGWVAGIAPLVLLDRVPLRTLALGIVAGAIVGAPALWAMLAANAATESGLAALPTRAPHAPLGPRLLAVATLPARVLSAFGRWGDGDASLPLLAASAVLAVIIAGGLVRLLVATMRGDRAARVVLVPGLVTTLLVLGLPGDAWYYYLDGVLPLWALAAGALVGIGAGGRRGSPARVAATLGTLAACAVLATCTVRWLRHVAVAGYIPVEPTVLTLDGRAGKDAPARGRLTTLAVKRRAAGVAATLGGDFETLWHRLHGPAFADATGDNGFWVRWSLEHARPPVAAARRHLAFWYADDPTAIALASAPPGAAVELTYVGPLLAARYTPRVDYESCRADGVPVAVPIRVTPDPRRYGDGTPALPSSVPSHLTCALRASPGGDEAGATTAADAELDPRRVVAALGGEGTVALNIDGRTTAPARVAALCAPARARALQVTIDRRDDAPAELDVYDVPLAADCPDSSDEAMPRVGVRPGATER